MEGQQPNGRRPKQQDIISFSTGLFMTYFVFNPAFALIVSPDDNRLSLSGILPEKKAGRKPKRTGTTSFDIRRLLRVKPALSVAMSPIRTD